MKSFVLFPTVSYAQNIFLRWKFQTRVINGKETCSWGLRGVCVWILWICAWFWAHGFLFFALSAHNILHRVFFDSSCSKWVFTVHFLCLLLWDRIVTDWKIQSVHRRTSSPFWNSLYRLMICNEINRRHFNAKTKLLKKLLSSYI